MNIHEKIGAIRNDLRQQFVERDDMTDALIVAMLSRQNVFVLGPPGTAKSAHIRSLSRHVEGGTFFDRLLMKTTKPPEIFGPLKLSALKEDKYEFQVKGYLPTAHFAFLDETFKANAAILNGLLTIMNERMFWNDGTVIDCPLVTLMGASNEIPEDAELAALYDRFLIRVPVSSVQGESNFYAMLDSNMSPDVSVTITPEELAKAQEEAMKVSLPRTVQKVLWDIKRALKAENFLLSDRRYKQTQKVLRAHAWLNGRKSVTKKDLAFCVYTMWDDPQAFGEIRAIILETVDPMASALEDFRVATEQEIQAFDRYLTSDTTEDGEPITRAMKISKGAEVVQKLQDIMREVRRMADEADTDEDRDELKTFADGLEERVNKTIGPAVLRSTQTGN